MSEIIVIQYVGVFDIFRFSKFSYLEHCNRVISTKKKGIHIHDKDG